MILKKLTIENFRNYDKAVCEFSPEVNVINGANAQGKTNLLESVYMTSLGKSFRQGSDKDIIKFGEEYCFVKNKSTTCAILIIVSNSHVRCQNRGGVRGIYIQLTCNLLIIISFKRNRLYNL